MKDLLVELLREEDRPLLHAAADRIEELEKHVAWLKSDRVVACVDGCQLRKEVP